MRGMALIVSVVALVSAAPVATATTVVYSTFGPGDSYSATTGWTIWAQGVAGSYQALACPFTVSGGDYLLDTIDVGILAAASHPVLVSLRAGGATVPGGILESFTLTPVSGIMSLKSVSQPLLRDGLSYWVAVEPGAAATFSAWCDAAPQLSGPAAIDRGAGWSPLLGDWGRPAYRVTGEPVAATVPEPITMISVLSGLTALGTYLRRRVA